MLLIVSQIIGVLAVGTFLLSYQQKKRKNIIIFNVVSRVLYILQYLLLGAFEGAVLDILGALSSVIATQKDNGFVKKHTLVTVIIINVVIVAAGILLYENVFSLLPMVGVLLQTTAFWINDERIIRRVSLAGSPFWFVYNFVSRAYGSAVGDVLTMGSIIIAMIKYRKSKQLDQFEKAEKKEEISNV